MKTAIVIGAGIGGLSAAVRLAAQGFRVEVFEQNEGPGGKLTEFSLGDYRFDFGPSLFTMPQFVMELFDVAEKDPADYFEYEAMAEACRYFFTDGTNFYAPTDETAFIDKASDVFDVDRKKIQKYFNYNKKIYEEAGQIFLTKPIQKLKTWLSRDVLKFLGQSYVIELFRSMNDTNARMLEDPRLVQMFNRYATYNGSNPYKAPAILNSISVLEHLYGTYFPKGGMSRIAKSIHELGEEMGVRFHFSQPVNEVMVENGKAVGVKAGDKSHTADVVVCNMDVNFAYDRLLPGYELPRLVKSAEKSSSAVIWYWGIGKKDDSLGLHNIFFTDNYPAEFEHLFDHKTLYHDPTVYINITSTQEASDAPAHGSNWFVMINAPSDDSQDWEAEIKRARENVIKKISQKLGWDVATHIEEERVVTPKDIETLTYSHKGALYGTSSNSQLSAFMRHPNMTKKIKDLYFVGGSVHPGGGIPLCLLSAKITSELIQAHG